ncbi:MAG: ABC transporter ATP-binding protein [Clostridia bacterium]|nr:ABC transporter ATP-binding protein [Clostridia bacterium]
MDENRNLLEVRNLKKYYRAAGAKYPGVQAVENISLSIRRGETLGIVGESGCGKSTLGRAILRLCEPDAGKIIYDGNVIFDAGGEPVGKVNNKTGETVKNKDGEPVTVRSKKVSADMTAYRRRMQMIFQDPFASLDPRMTAGEIIGEAIDIHRLASNKAERADMIKQLLARVGLNTEDVGRLPHEFSGGQQQRIGIARALAVKPEFIVCDEPVSALDVSIRAQIVGMLENLQNELGLTYMFIAHDLSVVRHIANRTGVMYLGSLVELSESGELFRHPLHPYTQTLLSAVPVPDPQASRAKKRIILGGEISSPFNPPAGCRFCTRCPYATDICREKVPEFKEYEKGHFAACHLLEK